MDFVKERKTIEKSFYLNDKKPRSTERDAAQIVAGMQMVKKYGDQATKYIRAENVARGALLVSSFLALNGINSRMK